MKVARRCAVGILGLIFVSSLFANFFAPRPAMIAVRGCCTTLEFLLLAPAAALISTLMAVVVGAMAGYAGGWWDRVVRHVIDFFSQFRGCFFI